MWRGFRKQPVPAAYCEVFNRTLAKLSSYKDNKLYPQDILSSSFRKMRINTVVLSSKMRIEEQRLLGRLYKLSSEKQLVLKQMLTNEEALEDNLITSAVLEVSDYGTERDTRIM